LKEEAGKWISVKVAYDQAKNDSQRGGKKQKDLKKTIKTWGPWGEGSAQKGKQPPKKCFHGGESTEKKMSLKTAVGGEMT